MNKAEREELIEYRITRSKKILNEVELLVENELWNTSINRLYYACYYAVTALLVSKKIQAQTHSGVRQMFGLHFIKTGLIDKKLGRFYTDIFDKRQTGDYDDFVVFSKEDVKSMMSPANELVDDIEKLLKL